MAASEDELAKQEVKEAVWTWAGRFAALLAAFAMGWVTAFWSYGYGPEGAPHLRKQAQITADQMLELKNKRIDLEGQVEVLTPRLSECNTKLGECRTNLAKAKLATQ